MILAGDIGGTKSNIALMDSKPDPASSSKGCLSVAFIHRYANHEYTRFDDIIDDFLSRAGQYISGSPRGRIAAAGFGVAGPVTGRSVRITNLSWGLDADTLERQLGTRHIVILNDLEATGYSLACLTPQDFCTLNEGNAGAPWHSGAHRRGHGPGRSHTQLEWQPLHCVAQRRGALRLRAAHGAGDRVAALP